MQGAIVAVLLVRARRNRLANRLIAGLLAVVTLRLAPFIAGYAGAYDAYPWLSFAPYNAGLAFGPLVFLAVVARTSGVLPRRWWLHLLPAACELAYSAAIFIRPLAFKNAWDEAVQEPFVAPIERWAILVSAAIYTIVAWRRYREYRRWLGGNVSFGADVRTGDLASFLIGVAALLALWTSFSAYDRFVAPLSYASEFPLYVAFAAFTYALALAAWRNADRSYPVPEPEAERAASVAIAVPIPIAVPVGTLAAHDAPTRGVAWLARIRDEHLYRDPDLTLASLAHTLGTNTTYLSSSLNEDVGENFNACINRLRVEAVSRELDAKPETDDLLTLALDSGFRSKASFNRAFKTYTGTTPSAYRAAARAETGSQILRSTET